MNEADLVLTMTSSTSLRASEVKHAANESLYVIIQAAARGKNVRQVGLWSSVLTKCAARAARNFHTGEANKVPALQIPKFCPGKSYKEGKRSVKCRLDFEYYLLRFTQSF